MATRSRTTFKKRQKELARMEKQRDKAARRLQRKKEKQLLQASGDAASNIDEGAAVADVPTSPSGPQ